MTTRRSRTEQVKRPNPWREMMIYIVLKLCYNVCKDDDVNSLTVSAFCWVGSNIYKTSLTIQWRGDVNSNCCPRQRERFLTYSSLEFLHCGTLHRGQHWMAKLRLLDNEGRCTYTLRYENWRCQRIWLVVVRRSGFPIEHGAFGHCVSRDVGSIEGPPFFPRT